MRYLKDEEFNIASRFLFLSMARVVIQLDIENIEQGPFKIKNPYLFLLRKMISKATNERRHLRKLMKDKSIQVVIQHKNETLDRKSTRLNSSHVAISYAVFCLKK